MVSLRRSGVCRDSAVNSCAEPVTKYTVNDAGRGGCALSSSPWRACTESASSERGVIWPLASDFCCGVGGVEKLLVAAAADDDFANLTIGVREQDDAVGRGLLADGDG